MPISIDEHTVLDGLRHYAKDAGLERSMARVVSDHVCLSLFLVGLSRGESLGEQGVAAISEEEISRLIEGLEVQRLEEHGHSEGALMLARELCPEDFEDGSYRYEASVGGTAYYFKIRELNRARLKKLGKYSRLNLYLTTSFGYEIMVELLFGTLLKALDDSPMPPEAVERIRFVVSVILSQEEEHAGLVAEHNLLLAADRNGLGERALAMIESLGAVEDADYLWTAELSVREIVPFMSVYAFPEHIERCVSEAVPIADPEQMKGLPLEWPVLRD